MLLFYYLLVGVILAFAMISWYDGGLPYIVHPMGVLHMLGDIGVKDEDTLTAAILHEMNGILRLR
jgi:hypothetical protein